MSVTARLVILVVAVLMPALAAAVWGIHQAYRWQKEVAEQSLRQLSHALAAVVEEEFAHHAGILQTLARSPALLRGDLPAFYEFARSIVPGAERTLVLADLEGRQIINTRLPFASDRLPASRNFPELRARLGAAPDEVVVSDAYFAPVGQRYSFAVQVPVLKDGRVAYYLSMGSFGETLQKLLADQRLRSGWNAAILDRKGILIARRIEPERFVGKPATDAMMTNLRQAREGLFEAVRLDGVSTLTAYAPIGDSGWTFVVSMPRAELQAGLTRTLLAASIIILCLFALALLVALGVGRSITRPLRALVESAAAVGRGEPPPQQRHRLAEARQIGAELERASAQIGAARSDLERRVERAVGEARRAEEALLQNQKLEALGRLTGGIAHDFNNLLQTISVSMELTLRQSQDSAVVAAMEAGKRAVQNAVKLTRQLMSFGRAQPTKPATVDLRDEALRMQDLIARALRSDIQLRFDFPGALWPVNLDVMQLELALLNTALNAKDALPKGGRLVIGARNATLAEGADPRVPAGDYVRLTIADSGTGIPRELLSRVFEPFFTTKEVGKGSGLGLAQVYGFALRSGGTATIDSEPGAGTTVTLWLPRHSAAALMPQQSEAPAAPPKLAAPRKVLFVEDDALVRDVVAPALESAGFRVLRAGDVAGALRQLEQHPDTDIVFSDVVMPGGRNGIDLAEELRRTHPRLPVVLATGYADGPSPTAAQRVIAKPYRLDDLLRTLVEALP